MNGLINTGYLQCAEGCLMVFSVESALQCAEGCLMVFSVESALQCTDALVCISRVTKGRQFEI
jgi:hypothetical protein